MSLSNIREIKEGLTYDDVLLVPAYSEVLPRDVKLKSKITRNIEVNAPIVSAAMDTVTEARLAVAIAQQGGIGVIHKNMTIAQQASEVLLGPLETEIAQTPYDVVYEEDRVKLKYYQQMEIK